jgi:hypothetical protein
MPLGASGRYVAKENGYDSGKVIGIVGFDVGGGLVRSTAFRDVGLWNSRYESNNLHVTSSSAKVRRLIILPWQE